MKIWLKISVMSAAESENEALVIRKLANVAEGESIIS